MFYKLTVKSKLNLELKEFIVEDLGNSFKLLDYRDTSDTDNVVYKNFHSFFETRFNILECNELKNNEVNTWLITESLGA